jgi:aryl-alcohol dehydrogenase-like predicted oxidoreductase
VRTRPFDNATVTLVGAGDTCLARSASRGIERSDVARALGELVELGGNVVDCADELDAEQLVGETLRELRARDRVVVATRVTPQPSAVALARSVQARVEASLRATRLDALPVAVLPVRVGWRDTPAWAELAGTCGKLVRDGKVMRWGAAVHAEDLEAGGEPWLAEPWLVALRVELSLCDRRALALVDAVAAPARGTPCAVLVARPLAGGALAGSLGPGMRLPLRDDRNAMTPEALDRVSAGIATLARYVRDVPAAARATAAGKATLENLKRIEPLASTDVAELALRWAIDRVPGGGIALPRLHRGHVAAAVKAATAALLPRDLIAQLDAIDI